jgi:glycosyltransferase involved in cell wall biosynthesis
MRNLPSEVEIVVVDGDSEDDTKSVLENLRLKSESLSFRVQEKNSGIDGGYSEAASLSRGQYIWFVSDDDEILQDAPQRVVKELMSEGPLDVLVLNYAVWNEELTEEIVASRIEPTSRIAFSKSETDDLFEIAGGAMTYLASTVVSRERWDSIEPETFLGSYFVHVAASFASPAIHGARIILDPLIRVRGGVPSWRAQSAVIWLSRWPRLIQQLGGLSEGHRDSLKKIWKSSIISSIMWQRALGNITLTNFRKVFLELPPGASNKLALIVSLIVSFKALNYVAKVRVKKGMEGGRDLAWEAHELGMRKVT